MTAPSQTSTDNPAFSQPASGEVSPDPAAPPETTGADDTAAALEESSLPPPGDDAITDAAVAVTALPEPSIPSELQPRELWIDELHALTHLELLQRAETLRLRVNAEKNRHHLVFDLLRAYHALGFTLFAEGVTEFITSDGCGFVRFPRYSFRPGPQDPFVSFQLAKRLKLKGGNLITVRFRPPGHREKYMAVEEILTIESLPISEWKEPKDFETLTFMNHIFNKKIF